MTNRLFCLLCTLVLCGCETDVDSVYSLGNGQEAEVNAPESESSATTDGETVAVEAVSAELTGDGVATLTWTPPSTREDGSELADLSGYNIYYGQLPGVYTHIIELTDPASHMFTVEDLSEGTWYFAISAYDSLQFESALTDEVSKLVSL